MANAQAIPVVNVQDLWGLTFNPQSGYWSPDDIHPNTLGVAQEYDLIAPSIHID